MATIELDVTIEQGIVTIVNPLSLVTDIPDGLHHAVMVIEPVTPRQPMYQLLSPRRWYNSAPDSRFSREDIYDVDGR